MSQRESKLISLRSVQLSDAFDLHHNCFSEQAFDQVYDYLEWCESEQAKDRIVRLVATEDGQVIANGELAIRRDWGEIGSLVVAAPCRQRRIGTALIGALIAQARAHKVRTLEITARADTPWIRAWYERLGFVFQRDHTFPGQEQVAILHMALDDHDEEAQCPPTKA
jgi:ribosomal protein S18 acetylase RimI-like enzyme